MINEIKAKRKGRGKLCGRERTEEWLILFFSCGTCIQSTQIHSHKKGNVTIEET